MWYEDYVKRGREYLDSISDKERIILTSYDLSLMKSKDISTDPNADISCYDESLWDSARINGNIISQYEKIKYIKSDYSAEASFTQEECKMYKFNLSWGLDVIPSMVGITRILKHYSAIIESDKSRTESVLERFEKESPSSTK